MFWQTNNCLLCSDVSKTAVPEEEVWLMESSHTATQSNSAVKQTLWLLAPLHLPLSDMWQLAHFQSPLALSIFHSMLGVEEESVRKVEIKLGKSFHFLASTSTWLHRRFLLFPNLVTCVTLLWSWTSFWGTLWRTNWKPTDGNILTTMKTWLQSCHCSIAGLWVSWVKSSHWKLTGNH